MQDRQSDAEGLGKVVERGEGGGGTRARCAGKQAEGGGGMDVGEIFVGL